MAVPRIARAGATGILTWGAMMFFAWLEGDMGTSSADPGQRLSIVVGQGEPSWRTP